MVLLNVLFYMRSLIFSPPFPSPRSDNVFTNTGQINPGIGSVIDRFTRLISRWQ